MNNHQNMVGLHCSPKIAARPGRFWLEGCSNTALRLFQPLKYFPGNETLKPEALKRPKHGPIIHPMIDD